jgi:PAS domain S-box-containing protein
MREAAARYNAVFGSNFIAATVVSLPDRVYIDCNQAFLDLVGCTREQIVGKSVAEVGIVLGHQGRGEIDPDLYGSGELRDREAEITVRGEPVILLYSSVLVKVDGRLSVLTYMRDVTIFRRMLDQISESEKRFKVIFYSSPDPIAILAGPGFKVMDVNEAATVLVGYSRDELIGKRPAEMGLLPDLTESLSAGDTALLGGSLRNQEVRLRTREGESVTVLCSVVAVELDRQPCLLAFMRDITARKRAEQQIGDLNWALQNQTVLLQSILASLGEAVVVTGPDGCVTQFNAEAERIFGSALAGLTPGQWLARYPSFHADGSTPIAPAQLPRVCALRGEHVDQMEMLVRLSGNRHLWLAATARPLLTAGQVQGSVTVFHDIGERKQFEAQLARARRGAGVGTAALGVRGQHEPRDPHADERHGNDPAAARHAA